MPISSGATGRVDVGIDTSIAWTPDGLKRETKPASRNCDSYLRRYLETTQQRKHTIDSTEDRRPCDRENDGARDEKTQKNEGSEGDTSDKPPREQRSKKSRTCTLL